MPESAENIAELEDDEAQPDGDSGQDNGALRVNE